MTTNQIKYHELNETSRHNHIQEAEQNRSNLENEKISWHNLAESTRSHKANERITSSYNKKMLKETKRSHRASERIEKSKIGETKRSNRATETLTKQNNLANQALTEKKIQYEAAARAASLAEERRKNDLTALANQVRNQVAQNKVDVLADQLEQKIKMDKETLALNKRIQNYKELSTFVTTAVDALSKLGAYKNQSKKLKAEVAKIQAETKKLDLENDVKQNTLTSEKMNKHMSVINNAASIVGQILRGGAYGASFFN